MNLRNELAKSRIYISDQDWSQRGSVHYLRVGTFIVAGTGVAIVSYAKAQKRKNIPELLGLIQSKAIRILEATKEVVFGCGLP